VGTTDLDFWRLADKLRSVLPTLSHKTRWGTLSRNATGKKAAFKGWWAIAVWFLSPLRGSDKFRWATHDLCPFDFAQDGLHSFAASRLAWERLGLAVEIRSYNQRLLGSRRSYRGRHSLRSRGGRRRPPLHEPKTRLRRLALLPILPSRSQAE